MSDLRERVIQYAWQLRAKQQLVDRDALALHFEAEDPTELINIWQIHLESDEAKHYQAQNLEPILEQTLSSLSSQIAMQLNLSLKEAEVKVEALQYQLFDMEQAHQNTNSDYQQQIDQLRTALESYGHELEVAHQHEDELHFAVEQNRQQIERKKQESRSVTDQLATALADVDSLKLKLQQAKDEGEQSTEGLRRQYFRQESEMQNRLKKKDQILDEQLDMLRQQQQKIERLEQQLLQSSTGSEDAASRFELEIKQEREQYQTQIKDANCKIEVLDGQLNEVSRINRGLETDKHKLDADLTLAQRELERANSKLEQNQKDNQQHIQQLEQSLDELKQTQEQTKHDLQLSIQSNNELEAQLEREHAQFRRQIDTLEKQLDQAKQQHTHEVDALKSQLDKSHHALDDHKQRLKDAEQQYRDQESEFAKQKHELESMLGSSEREATSAKQQLGQLEEDKAHLKQEVSRLEQRYQLVSDRANQESEKIRENLKELRDKNQALNDDIATLEHDSQQQITEYKLKFDYAQRELNKLLEQNTNG